MTDSAQNAKNTLTEYKNNLDHAIENFFDKYIEEKKSLTPYARLTLEELKSVSIRGGKRVRPSLAHYIYTLLGGTDLENIRMAEVALDLNATYILIADDFMDLSPLRRGSPTIHENITKYAHENFPNTTKDLVHFGHSQAINVGLLCAHLAQLIIINTNFPDNLKLEALRQINEGDITTAHGQILDLFGEINEDLNEDDINLIMEVKTAYYTFVNPLLFGAAFVQADENIKEMLKKFGIKAGIAFQIQDDILGMFGDEEKLGKPADSDLKEGKRTLLIKYALDSGSDEQKEIIKSALGNHDLTDEMLQNVRKIIIETGALEKTKAHAQDLINEAKQIFISAKTDDWDQESFEYLTGLIQYMIERDL